MKKIGALLVLVTFLLASTGAQVTTNQFPSAGGSAAAIGRNINGQSAQFVQNVPASGSQATISVAAGFAGATGIPGVRHVANCITVSAGSNGTPTATTLQVNLRDGATGAGTILWSTTIVASATTGQHGGVAFCGLNIVGSVGTAMTLEFSAGLASEQEAVALSTYDVQG
jgi:hypothetical protein